MEIEDYLPNYPLINDTEFNMKILKKKEFNDLVSGKTPPKKGRWPHQELLSRFLGSDTMYNETLMFHTPGTGKTCGSIAVAENLLKVKNKVVIIVPNDILVAQWKKEIAFVCTDGKYIPEHFYSTDPSTRLTKNEKITRLNKMLRSGRYIVTTYGAFKNKKLTGRDAKFIKKEFSNSLIILDEAHNLRKHEGKKKKESEALYKEYHNFLHSIENSKILLLTGTPMVDSIDELPGLLNLILPLNEQYNTKTFKKKFLGENKIKNEKEFFKPIISRISYIREGGTFPERIDHGVTEFTKHIKTVNNKMSETQKNGYLEAYNRDETTKTSGLRSNSTQAINFVFEEDGKYYWGKEAEKLLVTQKKVGSRKLYSLKQKYSSMLRDNLQKYSSKYYHLIKLAKENPTTPIFVFNPLVHGTGGSIFLSIILKLFDIKVVTITAEESISNKKNIDLFNSKENRNAEQIQVLIGSKAVSTGTSLINVKDVVTVSPWWNNSVTEQAISRGIRADSLSYLSESERVVNVYQYANIHEDISNKENIDVIRFRLTESKDIEIKTFERGLKRVGWDCAMNYQRNYKPGKDGSRDCDYTDCEWKCYQITSPGNSTNVPLDYNTYNLYYFDESIKEIINILSNIFKETSIIDISQMKNENMKLIVISVDYIIKNNVMFTNKYGISCFLKNDGNILYLTESLDTKLDQSWYTIYTIINEITNLSEVFDNEIILKDLENFDCNDVSNLDILTQTKVLEMLYTISLSSQKAKEFLGQFKNKLFIFDDISVHNLLKTRETGNYIDFNKGDDGVLRCFTEGWKDCEKKESDLVSKLISEEKLVSNKDIIENEYKVYAVIENDKFKIADKTKEKGGSDRRKVFTGSVCVDAGWSKKDLLLLAEKLGIDAKELKMKKQICNILRDWFIENNLVIYN